MSFTCIPCVCLCGEEKAKKGKGVKNPRQDNTTSLGGREQWEETALRVLGPSAPQRGVQELEECAPCEMQHCVLEYRFLPISGFQELI